MPDKGQRIPDQAGQRANKGTSAAGPTTPRHSPAGQGPPSLLAGKRRWQAGDPWAKRADVAFPGCVRRLAGNWADQEPADEVPGAPELVEQSAEALRM